MNHHPRQDPNPFENLVAGLAMGDTFAGLLGVWLTRATAETGRVETAALKSVTRRLSASLGSFDATDINPLLMRSYVQARVDEGLAPRTVENHLRVLRRAFAYGVQCGVVTHNPALGVTVPVPPPADGGQLKILRKRGPKKSHFRGSATQTCPNESPKSAASNPKRPALSPNSQGVQPNPPSTNPTVGPKPNGNEPKLRGNSTGWEFVRIGQGWAASSNSEDTDVDH